MSLSTHKMTGDHLMSKEGKREVARAILFLYSDEGFCWNEHSMLGGCLINLATLGFYHRRKRKQLEAQGVFMGDDKVWPFLESYYEGRIPKKRVESDSFSVASCNDCDLLFQEYILNNSNMALLYEEWISAEDSLDKKRYANMSLFKRMYSLSPRGKPR